MSCMSGMGQRCTVRYNPNTCQNYLNVSASFESVIIIIMCQNLLNTVKLSIIFDIEIILLGKIIQFS